MRRAAGEAGYAVLAAMVAAAGFACLALQVAQLSRAGMVGVAAEGARARMAAAGEAGFALAMAGLESADPAARWTLNGDPHRIRFDDVGLEVRIEDEAGKIPLNTLGRDKARLLFARAGAPAEALDALVAGFLAARGDPGAAGASTGRAPGFDAVSDLARIPGVTPALYAAMAPAVSVVVRDAAFEPRTATPLALEVMTGAAPDAPEVLQRARELAGETPALDAGPPLRLAGRPLTLRVAVDAGAQGRWRGGEIVEPTRAPDRPFIVRGLAEPLAPPSGGTAAP